MTEGEERSKDQGELFCVSEQNCDEWNCYSLREVLKENFNCKYRATEVLSLLEGDLVLCVYLVRSNLLA